VPGDYTNPQAPTALSEVRKLVDNGQFSEATKAAINLSGQPSDVCTFICVFFVIEHCLLLIHI